MSSGVTRVLSGAVALVVIFASVAAFLIIGISDAIGGFYHPNETQASYGHAYAWVFAVLLIPIPFYALYVIVWGAVETRLKHLGIAFLVILAVFGSWELANMVHRNYHAEYYIGTQKYSIPWQYNPINGQKVPGGTYFVIQVTYPEFKPMYEEKDYYTHQLTLSRHTDEKGVGTSLDSLCDGVDCMRPGSNAYFKDDQYVYQMHYQGKQGSEIQFKDRADVERFEAKVVTLFDSFKVTD